MLSMTRRKGNNSGALAVTAFHNLVKTDFFKVRAIRRLFPSVSLWETKSFGTLDSKCKYTSTKSNCCILKVCTEVLIHCVKSVLLCVCISSDIFTSRSQVLDSRRMDPKMLQALCVDSMPAYTSQTSVNNLETRYYISYWIVCTFIL